VRTASTTSIRLPVGFVTQESYLFAGSLHNDIAYALPDATIEEVEKAARAAAIHERIMEFEDGCDATTGSTAMRLYLDLPGGQRSPMVTPSPPCR